MEQTPPKFLCRCSSLGSILGGAFNKPTAKQLERLNELAERTAGNGKPLTANMEAELKELIAKRDSLPALLDGAKTYLQDWMKERLYGRRKEFSNKKTEKGIVCEPQGIEMTARIMNYGMISKNTVRKSNDWITGECDLDLAKITEDIKCSWDIYTFPLFETKLPNSDYYYQGQGYMWLYGTQRYAVNYCLLDAPEDMIDQAARSASYAIGQTEVTEDLYNEVRQKMTYGDIPDWLKFKRFEFDRDENVIAVIKQQVELCQDYINAEWPKIFAGAPKEETT